ncbi:hypothetical protein [Tunturiibacter lichenicola]|uniref:hypothetical protein n=1 Tax=Tunturiibacter lichenicola TaxID=2051959 RepID=UPI0021B45155|nr:hypothetical protein [Edaphobacter lichenicola]
MKLNAIALTTAAFTLLALGFAPNAKADCSEATLKGHFAYTSIGPIVANAPASILGPSAEVGVQYFDGRGGVSFKYNASTNGSIGPGTGTGTYTVSDDCTGTFTETSEGFTSHFSFVIDENGVGFQGICQDTGVVVTRSGRRQFLGGDWK